MAYAAVVSLKHTIKQLMLDSSDILLDPHSSKIIEFAYMELNSLHKHLKKLNISRSGNSSVSVLDEGMREAVCRIEDAIESHVFNHLFSQSQGHPLSDLQHLKPEIISFTAALNKMKLAYLQESSSRNDDDSDADADADDDATSALFGSAVGNIVGVYSDQIPSIREEICSESFYGAKFVSLFGTAGIGKTTLAMEIFQHPDTLELFKSRAWVTFGRRKRKFPQIARQILAQLNPDSDNKLATQEEEELSEALQHTLRSKTCLIVLDDIWDSEIFGEMRFHYKLRGSRVLVTTRLKNIAAHACSKNYYSFEMRLLNKEKSWDLFCGKMFGEERCPHELVIPGKKIVEKCEGLPLLIITMADLLSNKEKNPEYWNEVAQDKKNRLLKDACKQITEVLFPSYDHLPQHIKTCFLYMGVFPQDYEIPKSIIMNLWKAERFLELEKNQPLWLCARKCLNELVSNNVVIVYQKTLMNQVKTCGLHFSFWYLCNIVAEKNKFLHVFNTVEDGLEESIKGHRRLCIHNNVLFGIKDVYSTIQRVCASTARSLLCFGPYHQYEVPLCFHLGLLKILDALAIRFYDFPLEVLKLVLLKYLALTCNGKLPPSITKLWKLQLLIVGRHLSIKSNGAPSYLPMEIWGMQKLEHLQIMGSDLPDPCGNLLPKLKRLIGVSARSCTKEVLEGIPYLEKLGILIEVEPNSTEPFRRFDHISNLESLRSLKCVVVNPMFVTTPAAPPFSMLPSRLTKLHLSGMGCPWEHMNVIASLPTLYDLKLRCYAFQGPKWEIQDNQFQTLATLLIEDTDLVQMKAESKYCFPHLRRVTMKHCYRLKEINLALKHFADLEQIELIDCNKPQVSSETVRSRLVVHSSWNDGNLYSSPPTPSKRIFLKAW